jgi:hypothetical protein
VIADRVVAETLATLPPEATLTEITLEDLP